MYKIIGADLKEYGPVSAEQLRLWVVEGRVNGQTRVKAENALEWRPMAELPEFADVLPKTPPPSLTPSPISSMPAVQQNSSMAVWAMVTGILALLCCGLLAPVAIILGAVSLSQFKTQTHLTGRGFAIAGIVMGIVALIVHTILAIFFFSMPGFFQNFQR